MAKSQARWNETMDVPQLRAKLFAAENLLSMYLDEQESRYERERDEAKNGDQVHVVVLNMLRDWWGDEPLPAVIEKEEIKPPAKKLWEKIDWDNLVNSVFRGLFMICGISMLWTATVATPAWLQVVYLLGAFIIISGVFSGIKNKEVS